TPKRFFVLSGVEPVKTKYTYPRTPQPQVALLRALVAPICFCPCWVKAALAVSDVDLMDKCSNINAG
ncbi:hypothetical protein ABLA30_13045, partial [Xenorhabdus nematophila]|uniref:hypothetical protein n=1 Tax=Xenorhabdus nematophila TaxID=628 RepID=UPI0032B7B6F0